jgi:adenylylsulfate kinase-like enzyme
MQWCLNCIRHYRRVKAGEIKEFAGISSPYEDPEQADVVLDNSIFSIEQCVAASDRQIN